jgi:broad specificity phosphatase PhoE
MVPMAEITFIRHAETTANADGVWSGRTNVPLTDAGEESLRLLGARLAGHDADIVISSSLDRATRTAAAFEDDFVVDDQFLEIDLGEWDGMLFAEIKAEQGDELAEAFADHDHPMGRTGESLNDVGERALRAVDGLAKKLGEDGKAIVVTHGGFLQAVLGRHLTAKGRRIHAFSANTGLSRVVWSFGSPRLASFNDTGHLGPRSGAVAERLAEGETVLSLIRHGQTQANVERRWQGHGDWGLDELGSRQAVTLGEWYGRHPTVYSSPLMRAAQTAARVASNGVVEVEGLKELSMGLWEGLTSNEILEKWPDRMETIYRHGVDLRRGETGESWGELTARFRTAVHGVPTAGEGVTILVAHGGAIRSYVSSLTSVRETHAEALFTPTNTSVTHVALTDDGPELLDYAVAPHLETLS